MTELAVLDAAIDQAIDPMAIMQRVVDETMALVPGAEGVSIGLIEGDTITGVCAAGRLRAGVGMVVHTRGSLTGLASRHGKVLFTGDAATDPRVPNHLPELGIASLVCVPLHHAGKLIGALYVCSSRGHAFGEPDVATLTHVAALLAVVIGYALDFARVARPMLDIHAPAPGAQSVDVEHQFIANILAPGRTHRLEAKQRIDAVLEHGLLSMVFQPIVDLGSGEMLGVEALARFASDPARTPDVWFAEAHRVGKGEDLELAAIRAALTELRELPRPLFMAVNIGPEVLASRAFARLLHLVDASRVVIELTEHTRIDDYEPIQVALSSLRALGARLALDDTGAGYSGLNHILKLSPNLIKLDRLVTSGIDTDPVRRALAVALVSFTSRTGATIIAEGIETSGELAVLRDLGIRVGQGFHLAQPVPMRALNSAHRKNEGVQASVEVLS